MSEGRPADSERFGPRPFASPPFETALSGALNRRDGDCRVTLFDAPPGFGKTHTLYALHLHARRRGGSTIWIALDDRDRDVARVAGLVREACHQGLAGPDVAGDRKGGRQRTTGRSIATLAAAYGDGLDLFIDNLDLCCDKNLAGFLDQMISFWPAHLRLWLATSRHLDLDYARHGSEGVLRHLRMDQLAFTRDDTDRFLAQRGGPRLTSSDIDGIYGRTRGWPLAVSLVAATCAKQTAPISWTAVFSRLDADISSFLRSQMLSHLDKDVLQFLYRTAHLPEINYDLCRYATRSAWANTYINDLLEKNCYLSAREDDTNRLTFHPLALKAFVEESRKNIDPPLLRDVLGRGADWFRRHERWRDAIECALLAEMGDTVAAFLHEIAPVWVGQSGGLASYIDWVGRAKKIGAVLTLDSEYWYLWALLFSRQTQIAYEQSKLLWTRSLAEGPADRSGAQSEAFRRRFEELRILIAFFQDQTEQADHEARIWLGDQIARDHISVATVACCVAINASINFDFSTARNAISTARNGIVLGNSEYGAAWVAVLSAQIDFFEGDYRQCRDVLRQALARAVDGLGADAAIVQTLRLLLGCCLWETGEPDGAREQLIPALSTVAEHGVSEITFCALAAAIGMWDGGDAPDIVSPDRLEQLVRHYPSPMDIVFRCLLARRLLRLGRTEDALRHARRTGLDLDSDDNREIATHPVFVRELIALTKLDYFLSAGATRKALDLAEGLLATATSQGRRATAVGLEIDIADIAFRQDNPRQALCHMRRAIHLATRGDIRRPFLLRIGAIRSIVASCPEKKWGFANWKEHELFRQICASIRTEDNPQSVVLEEDPGGPTLSETLTPRELALLRLVDAGFSNQQIAESLDITTTTVKWHLSNIFSKLGVDNRTRAAVIFRSMHFI